MDLVSVGLLTKCLEIDTTSVSSSRKYLFRLLAERSIDEWKMKVMEEMNILHKTKEGRLTGFRFLWPCIMSKVWRERKTNKMQQSDVYYQFLSQHVLGIIMSIFRRTRPCVTAYGVLRWFCWMWLVAVVGRCVVGCEQCSHPTTQRPTTALLEKSSSFTCSGN